MAGVFLGFWLASESSKDHLFLKVPLGLAFNGSWASELRSSCSDSRHFADQGVSQPRLPEHRVLAWL